MRVTQDRADVRTAPRTEDVSHEGSGLARQEGIVSAHRATIDQAVGGLMVAYGLDADQAFEMLRWRSQDSNVKVRDLAARLTEAASRGALTTPAMRTTFDALVSDVSKQPTARSIPDRS